MNIIDVAIINKKAVRTNETAYVCDNSDFTVVFSFDEEWNEFPVKTARFVYGDKYQDIVFSGTKCPMPKISNTKLISVGVFAGDLHTTTPAFIVANKSILGESGVPDEPSPDVYAQIVELCGETKDIAQSVRDDADNGVFDGDAATTDQSYNPVSDNAQSGKAVAEAIKNKVDKVTGKDLSSNDFTNEYKGLVDSILNDTVGLRVSKSAVELLCTILENGIYTTDQSTNIKTLKQLMSPRDVDSDGYELIKKLYSDDIMYGYARYNSPPYYTTHLGRASYMEYDFPIESGYSYKVTFGTTYPTAQVGLQFLNELWKNGFDNKENLSGITGVNLYDPGWQNNGVIITPPEFINDSPVSCLGLTFRMDTNNSPVVHGFIEWVEVRRKRVE